MRNVEEIIARQIHHWDRITNTLRYQPGPGDEVDIDPPGARHPVICISREVGSGARLIAQELSERLGYEIFGTAVLNELAQELKLQRPLVDCLKERVRGELEAMVESWITGHSLDKQTYLQSLVRVMKTLAYKGGLVLIGRGASYILRDKAALTLLITAPHTARVERVMHYLQCDMPHAEKLIRDRDRGRMQFVRSYFKQDANDPHHFDLTIDTSRIDPTAAVEVIMRALEVRGFDLPTLRIEPPLTARV